MKFLVLTALIALSFSAYTAGTYTLTLAAAVGTATAPTKTNGTCNITVTHAAPFTLGTGTSGTPVTVNNGIFFMTSTALTSTAATDFGFLCTYATSSTGAAAVTTTFVTSPSCALYIGGATAYAANTTLTPYNPTVTTAATASWVLTLSYMNSNWTSQNFTKTSFSMTWYAVSAESTTAYTFSTTATGTAQTTTSALSLSGCAAMASYTSVSSVQSSIIGSILALSFF